MFRRYREMRFQNNRGREKKAWLARYSLLTAVWRDKSDCGSDSSGDNPTVVMTTRLLRNCVDLQDQIHRGDDEIHQIPSAPCQTDAVDARLP